jgi:hypothetical protein
MTLIDAIIQVVTALREVHRSKAITARAGEDKVFIAKVDALDEVLRVLAYIKKGKDR